MKCLPLVDTTSHYILTFLYMLQMCVYEQRPAGSSCHDLKVNTVLSDFILGATESHKNVAETVLGFLFQ